MKPTNYSDLRSMLIINGAITGYAAGSGGLTFVTDGTTTVGPVSSILFDGSSVSDLGAHEARVVGTARLFGQFTNKAGRDLADGDVVIIDPGTNAAVTTTPEGRTQTSVGVVYGTIPSNSVGFVQLAGFTNSVRVPFSQTRGYYLETNSMALQAVGNSTRRSGSFGQLLTSGLYPQAWLWGETDQTAGGGSDPLTTKGDIWGFSTVDARIPVGANATVLTADSTQALGVKWAAGGVSPLTTKGDLWGYSTVDARVPVGGNSTFLMASSIDTLGVAWGTPAGGGGGTSLPTVQQAVWSGTTATSVTITAASSGHTLLMITNSTTGQVTGPTCTNVTWTAVKQFGPSAGSSYYSLWVGVVAGGSSGTSITMTRPGSFNTLAVIEINDTVTPTTGVTGSANNPSSNVNTLLISGHTANHIIFAGGGPDNTTAAGYVVSGTPNVGFSGLGISCLVCYAPSTPMSITSQSANTGGYLYAEIS
jgi:hypothetical protein